MDPIIINFGVVGITVIASITITSLLYNYKRETDRRDNDRAWKSAINTRK